MNEGNAISTLTLARVSPEMMRELLRLNRSLHTVDDYARILEVERSWIVPLAEDAERHAPDLPGRSDFLSALRKRLSAEENDPSESARFLAHKATREQFASVVRAFAVDGLIEAQSFFPILPRLPHRSQMAVLRVLIDEFGCGNSDQAHSELYRRMLEELGMPTDVESYLDEANPEVLAFVNLFYWMAARAPQEEYFLGGLAYLEASILYAFRSFAAACERLGINGNYYTEHLHIDNFHQKEMLLAIRDLEATRPVAYRKVWAGLELASSTIAEAVDSAVAEAIA